MLIRYYDAGERSPRNCWYCLDNTFCEWNMFEPTWSTRKREIDQMACGLQRYAGCARARMFEFVVSGLTVTVCNRWFYFWIHKTVLRFVCKFFDCRFVCELIFHLQSVCLSVCISMVNKRSCELFFKSFAVGWYVASGEHRNRLNANNKLIPCRC